jgi:hypothetical protein
MDLTFTADQNALREAILQIVGDNLELPRVDGIVPPRTWHHADKLERDLELGGFFDIARTEGCGTVEAAILVYEAGFSPQVFECGASALVAPLLVDDVLPRPIALARAEDLGRPIRFLDRAQTVIVDMGNDVAVLSTAGLEVVPVESTYAYPLGRFAALPDLSGARRLGAARTADFRRLWRLALALETSAALQAAIDFTTAYVKTRVIFGRPEGSFQAVQHRLSADVEKARGAYWLAMRAAWSGDPLHAALAALHAQRAVMQVNYDVHQFNGALGMTLEHALHCWTFRLRWLVGELGGAKGQAEAVSRLKWADTAASS